MTSQQSAEFKSMSSQENLDKQLIPYPGYLSNTLSKNKLETIHEDNDYAAGINSNRIDCGPTKLKTKHTNK